MKSGTRLDSAVFHLTPTRTRCDLIITANGKAEKVASGLLNPFLAHLKTAQDQIAKGGYSVVLGPENGSEASWFTKGTVERFVRFVSNPEVLERVYTIESEILQIEEAITIQSNNDMGLNTIEDHPEQSVESFEGSKLDWHAHEEKAIVLYKPGVHQPESNGSSAKEGNSKVQLLKVLETRKIVLLKEQGMAFARAVAAGFEIDHIAPLMSFAELFGASRLMDACLRFNNLWTKKHETGQWDEIEATAAMASPPDFSSMNSSGITLANACAMNKQNEPSEGCPEPGIDVNAGVDNKAPTDHRVPLSNPEYMQGQFPHPMFPPWPVHSPPGTVPVFQAYPMQGIPYYQNYPGNVPYFHPPYQPVEDPRTNAGQRTRQRRKSMDSRDSNTEPETWDPDAPKIRSQDDLELHEQISQGQDSRKKGGRSGKRRSGTVVIRNINYITSKKQNSSDTESQSESNGDTDGDDGELQDVDAQMNNENSSRSSKRRGIHTKSVDASNLYDKDYMAHEKEADGDQWKAFQNYLLRDADEDKQVVDHGMFASEKEARVKRRQIMAGDDLLLLGGQDHGDAQAGSISDIQTLSGNLARIPKASKDEMLLSSKDGQSGQGGGSVDGQIQFPEVEGRGVYKRAAADDFIIHGRGNPSDLTGSSTDPLAVDGLASTNKLDGTSQRMGDESFIVPSRPGLLAQEGTGYRATVDIDSELPSLLPKGENKPEKGSQINYEPDDLSLVPERVAEKSSTAYDPAFDYEMQVHADTAMANKKKEVVADANGSKKLVRNQRRNATPNASDKKKPLGAKKGIPSKLSPLDEARARAEKLRSFKADLQKVKKEKEEEAVKRIEALKLERQKRIAARAGINPSSSLSPSEHAKKQLPTKRSPVLQKVSKFSDLETESSSPFHRAPKRTLSLEPSKSPITPKPSSSKSGSHLGSSRLTRSASSLPEPKKENKRITPDPKASMTRIRRLSEPKTRPNHDVTKPKPSDGHEKKKMSEIINLDKTKAATLPELKIRTPRGPPDESQGMPAVTEMTQKVNGTSEVSNMKGRNLVMFDHHDMDDNPIIEKTVVMLEREKPSAPTVHASNEMAGMLKEHYDDHTLREKSEITSDGASIRAPISEFNTDGVDRESVDHRVLELQSSLEETAIYTEKETPKFSSISNDEKPYQAPFARLSSIEDPCTRNSEYGKAPSSSEMSTTRTDAIRPLVSDFKNLKLKKIQEASEKSLVKDSAKGFRRLLKLGRKNHSSAAGGHVSESDNVSTTVSVTGENATNAPTAASSEVHILKNLISQDETPSAASTTQKSSGSFSLLSSFRSKNSEKKITT